MFQRHQRNYYRRNKSLCIEDVVVGIGLDYSTKTETYPGLRKGLYQGKNNSGIIASSLILVMPLFS